MLDSHRTIFLRAFLTMQEGAEGTAKGKLWGNLESDEKEFYFSILGTQYYSTPQLVARKEAIQ